MIVNANALQLPFASGVVQTVVTSPPYWRLRSYLPDHSPYKSLELGSEPLHDCLGWATGQPCGSCYVCHMVAVFREVRRVLKADGTVWLNLGDSFAGNPGNGRGGEHPDGGAIHRSGKSKVNSNTKPKDLCLIPHRVALALQADGWWVRSEIIWHKPSCLPESVVDRPTRNHEIIWLLAKSSRYYYDADAIREPAKDSSLERLSQDVENQSSSPRAHDGAKNFKAVQFGGDRCLTRMQSSREWDPKMGGGGSNLHGHSGNMGADGTVYITANKRDVWTVNNPGYKGAHFATFPEKLVEPCILAGSRAGDLVFDPFSGSGTTGRVALNLGRKFVGSELNHEYIRKISKERLTVQIGMGEVL